MLKQNSNHGHPHTRKHTHTLLLRTGLSVPLILLLILPAAHLARWVRARLSVYPHVRTCVRACVRERERAFPTSRGDCDRD